MIRIHGAGSTSTYHYAAQHDYCYCFLSYFGYKSAAHSVNKYWEVCQKEGRDLNPYRLGFLQLVGVSETDEQAERDYAKHVEYFYHKLLHIPLEWFGVPGDGSIRNYLPGKEEFKAHPEWFALRRDGTRDENMACMTSAGMIAHFVERVKADARAGKRYSAFAPDDGMPRCYCGQCQRLANGFDGYGANDREPLVEASMSNEWFHFIDAILDEVNKEFPDHKIASNGYANRDIPPELPAFNRRRASVQHDAGLRQGCMPRCVMTALWPRGRR